MNQAQPGEVIECRNPSRQSFLSQFARRVIKDALSGMRRGRLTIVDAEGICSFGDGALPSATIKVLDSKFWTNCLFYGDIGLAESFIDGFCEIDSIRGLISWFLINSENSTVLNESKQRRRVLNLLGAANKRLHKARKNTKSVAPKNIVDHYDLGNEFFALFLDKSMVYSSALFPADRDISLEQAQKLKFEKIGQSLRLSPGDRVLDLGCGWGALSMHMAREYGCKVTAVTISPRQYDFVNEKLQQQGLNERVEVVLTDYRNLSGEFDKIVSVEMIEAIGDEFLDVYIEKIDRILAKDGLALLQMITCADHRYDTLKSNVDFIQKHIFPGSLLPSHDRVQQAMRKVGTLQLLDYFDMTASYVRTLESWQTRFNDNSAAINRMGFSEAFIRKWTYYFEYCQAAFAMRHISVVQALYTRPNNLSLSVMRGNR